MHDPRNKYPANHHKYINELKKLLPAERIRTDDQSLALYGKDWGAKSEPHPQAILFPITTDEVRQIVCWCRKHKVAIVPSGGRTGLSGGAMALNNEIVLSLDLMKRFLDHNQVDATLHCQAGVIMEEIQREAEKMGFYYPVDFAAKGSSQIGGNIATNAGGIKVLRYGSTRRWITGLQVVAGTGEILELNRGLIKNAVGYDLRHLFIGSEGTLGVITETTVQLCRRPLHLNVLFFAVNKLSQVMEVYGYLKSQCELTAFEFFTDDCLEIVKSHFGWPAPLSNPSPFYLIVEIESADSKSDLLEPHFEFLFNQGWISDGILSQSPQQSQTLWKYRESIGEAISHLHPHKSDISVRISNVPELLNGVNGWIDSNFPDLKVLWFGHIGDGNLHINVLKPATMPVELFGERCARVSQALYSIVQELGGSVSAEHGVGLYKRDLLPLSLSPQEISFMKQIKAIFDPDHIMNPGKIFTL